jgi:hypothetical protein
MTAKYSGQFSVKSREELLQRYEEAQFIDCRINAYPETMGKDELLIQPPNFVFIDLDISYFGNDAKKLDKVKNSTLRKMEQFNGSHPTVSFTGNGYHIYLPIDVPVLDNEYIFSRDKFPHQFSPKGKYAHYYVSEVFMQFAEDYFTSGKSDPNHRPKYRTCLIRIPDTYNSKCLNQGLGEEESKVKILQKWNGKRIDAETLVHEFRIWLTQQEINLMKNKKPKPTIRKFEYKFSTNRNSHTNNTSKIYWIERLLQTPIEDHRKDCLWRIIGAYLLNVRKLSDLEASKIMNVWLDECDRIRKLDFEIRPKIYSIIKGNRGFKPISYLKLKEEYRDLYFLLENNDISKKI